MSTTIKSWYDFVLQQMAAESYLDQAATSPYGLTGILMLGSNRPGYLQSTGKLPTPATSILDGATRMTATQAADFTNRYQIIDHRGNDDARFAAMGANADGVNVQIGNGSGLSATLMKDNITGEYTLSVRSTEYSDNGGDWARDGYSGADGELGTPGKGFAFAQITALEEYYQTLIAQGSITAGTKLNVSGYSLGGHLASVFAELHPTIVDGTTTKAYVFNSPGHGGYDTSKGNLANLMADFKTALTTFQTANPTDVSSHQSNIYGIFGFNTSARMRRQIRSATINISKVANDEETHTWRVAA